MTGFENNPKLGKIFGQWGAAVADKEAKRARRASGLARVSEMPYVGHSEQQIAEHLALTRAKQGERDDKPPHELPHVPSPPIAPTRYMSEDDLRTERLVAYQTADTTKAEQLSLFG